MDYEGHTPEIMAFKLRVQFIIGLTRSRNLFQPDFAHRQILPDNHGSAL